jgi:hypothetical protein
MNNNSIFSISHIEKLLLWLFIREHTEFDSNLHGGLQEDYCIIIVGHEPIETQIRVCKIKTSDLDSALFVVKANETGGFVVKLRFMWLVTLSILPCLLGRAYYRLKK